MAWLFYRCFLLTVGKLSRWSTFVTYAELFLVDLRWPSCCLTTPQLWISSPIFPAQQRRERSVLRGVCSLIGGLSRIDNMNFVNLLLKWSESCMVRRCIPYYGNWLVKQGLVCRKLDRLLEEMTAMIPSLDWETNCMCRSLLVSFMKNSLRIEEDEALLPLLKSMWATDEPNSPNINVNASYQ